MRNNNPTPLLVDTPTAARLLGVSPSLLRKWLHTRDARAPRFRRIGTSTIRWVVSDLQAWVEREAMTPDQQEPPQPARRRKALQAAA